MKSRTVFWALTLAVLFVLGCAGTSTLKTAPARHPEELDRTQTDCLECHDDDLTATLKPYGTFRHSTAFLLRHGSYASQGEDLCAACHGASSCMECHATEEEIRPSVRIGNRPDRQLPHRGDYIVQHRIDGRVDPGSCIRCHGNRNDGTCAPCHQ
ncbi:MAG: cytochrome C [bacterium]|nr:MAG: cytochrome C [bacterium]